MTAVTKKIITQQLMAMVKSNNLVERRIRFEVVLSLLQQEPDLLRRNPKFHKVLTEAIRGTRPSAFYERYQDLCLPRSSVYNLRS